MKEISNQKVDLQVSGHTHAGQIWPTGQLMQFMGISDLNYGEKTMKNSRLIVTSGIGGWGYPIRTGGHCEYVIITHSTRILESLHVDQTHVLVDGKIAASGDASMVEEINEHGFEQYEK